MRRTLEPRRYLIYGLVDPRTNLVRYIGKSARGLARPKAHGYSGNLIKKTHIANWINQLRRGGLNYEIVVLEYTTPEQLGESECWWISYGRLSEWPLTNKTDGGEGCLGRVCSPETREKIASAQRGIPMSKGRKSALRKPKTLSQDQRQKIKERSRNRMLMQSGAMLDRLWSKEGAKERASERMKKLWADPEYSSHMSRAHTGHAHSDATKQKMRESASRGDTNPARKPEVRQKISEGLRRAWERRRNEKPQTK